jgi:hypothetical protein
MVGCIVLVHYHIPRTGGTTMVSMLKEQYGQSETVVLARTQPLSSVRQLISGSGLGEIKVLSTSHPFGVSRLVKAERNITMLRSPVQRVCSYFDLVRRTPGVINGRWQELHLMANRMTLAEYVASGEDPEVDNWQVRMLSGCGALPAFGDVKPSHLEGALANLTTKFDAVGTTENYDESVALFARVLGWPQVSTRRLNASSNADVAARRQVPSSTLALVRELNSLDEKLYRAVADEEEGTRDHHLFDRAVLHRS